jgi:hypothetical protein
MRIQVGFHRLTSSHTEYALSKTVGKILPNLFGNLRLVNRQGLAV